MQKRQLEETSEDDTTGLSEAKKFKYDGSLVTVGTPSNTVSVYNGSNSGSMVRLSSLMAPEVQLSGHQGAVFSLSFDGTGKYMCSGSYDRKILLWDVGGECDNYNVLSGHKNAVLDVGWKSDTNIISCSADKTVAVWDGNKGVRTRKLVDHTAIVNACAFSKEADCFASASDDCTVCIWDPREKKPVNTFYHDYQQLCVALSDDGHFVYSGGVDNVVRRYDTRMSGDQVTEPDMMLEGHTDTVTGLSLSPDGNKLLSNAMDSSLRVWDVRPFVAGGDEGARCQNVLKGGHHGAEKLLLRCAWSPDQKYVTGGSADRLVHIWDAVSFTELGCYPGHMASVNQVIFHPNPSEPVVASASSDKQITLGEFSF